MVDLTNPRHLHVEFRYEPVKNEAKSKEEGRPIYRDQEMVVIKFVTDKKKEIVAPAHEKFMRDHEIGEWVSYAEAFPRHYAAFKAGQSALMQGTPLRECGFLTKAQAMEFAALNLHSVEQLAALEGVSLQRLGLNGRNYKNKATKYLEASKDNAFAYGLMQENEDLRRRLEAFENRPAQDAPAPDLNGQTAAA